MELALLCLMEACLVAHFLMTVEFECWVEWMHFTLVDWTLCIAIQSIGAALYLVERCRSALLGPQWKPLLEVVLTWSQQKHWLALAFTVVFLLAVGWMSCRNYSCKRREKIQRRKRWSEAKRYKRCLRRSCTRGLSFLLLLTSGYGVESMDAQQFQQFMQGFGSLVQRQDAILRGVTETLGPTGSSASASVAKSLESAARILKTPDVFEASDSMSWVTWRHSFLNWLSYADSRFLDSIRDIEKLSPAESIETGDWTAAEWDLARKLYAILTSYLKGAALQLSRSGSDERNGFALWKTLIDHFALQTLH